MPYQSVRLQPGVDVEKTPTLNQTGWAATSFIRWRDGLVEKYGGWVKYYNGSFSSPVRALHAWLAGTHDFNTPDSAAQECLAVATENALQVLVNQVPIAPTLTPTFRTADVAPNFTTSTTTPTDVRIVAAASNLSVYSAVNITTPVSIDGLMLYGQYPVTAVDDVNTFHIAVPQPGATSAASGGSIMTFTTVSGSPLVTATLANNGFFQGNEIDLQVPTTVGGLTLQGVYTINSVAASGNSFTFIAGSAATSAATAPMNGGNVHYIYYPVAGPVGVGTPWGSGGWGVNPPPPTGGTPTLWGLGAAPPFTPGTSPVTGATWTLDNWGTYLVACPDQGPIFYWQPTEQSSGVTTAGVGAQLIAQAPQCNHGIFVMMPLQILVAYGSTTLSNVHDPLLVRWCDVGNFFQWTASSTNQAGSYRIPEGSQIVAGISIGQQALLFTDIETWSMNYIGAPLVFGFNKIGTGSGTVSRHAVAQLAGITYWMGQGNFYSLADQGVSEIACTVWDAVFQNINRNAEIAGKICCAPNSIYNEVSWFYASASSTEVDSYVKYSIPDQAWDYGLLQRTAWIDHSALGPPIGGDAGGFVYQHEQGNDADTAPMLSFAQTGWFMISEGDPVTFIDLILPDFQYGFYPARTGAQVQITIYTADWPAGPVHQLGPYTVSATSKWFNVRARGRMMMVKLSSSDFGSFWRMGDLRYRGQSDGRRGE